MFFANSFVHFPVSSLTVNSTVISLVATRAVHVICKKSFFNFTATTFAFQNSSVTLITINIKLKVKDEGDRVKDEYKG